MTIRQILPILFLIACTLPATTTAQCNGDTTICNRRFDQVCFLYTHNSYNTRGRHRLPNQNISVAAQLAAGVRGLMLDVYVHGDRVMLYHGRRIMGHRPLQEDLTAIRQFLAANPNEIMSIIFESHVPVEVLADAVQNAGLLPYLHAQSKGKPWPTLSEMVATNHRLVLFSEKDQDNPYPWLHHIWDFATENRYSNHSRTDFDARYNRGDSSNTLFLLNHFITHPKFGTGREDSATVANSYPSLIDHGLSVWAENGHFPNFVAVDFVEIGLAKAAVDSLNHLWKPTFFEAPKTKPTHHLR